MKKYSTYLKGKRITNIIISKLEPPKGKDIKVA